MEIQMYSEEQSAIHAHYPFPYPTNPTNLHLYSIFEEAAEEEHQRDSKLQAEDGLMELELMKAGFATGNGSLMCVQMVNALQLQMDVLERIIFKNTPLPIFAAGIGFSLNDAYAFQALRLTADPAADSLFQASPEEQFTRYEQASGGRNGSKSTLESEVCEIVKRKWASVSEEEKKAYLALRRKIEELRRVIAECLTAKQGLEHVCMLCGDGFSSGRQLGGHMSRRHPGNSTDYSKKRRLHNTKTVERDRRKYFKGIRRDPVSKKEPITKTSSPLFAIAEEP